MAPPSRSPHSAIYLGLLTIATEEIQRALDVDFFKAPWQRQGTVQPEASARLQSANNATEVVGHGTKVASENLKLGEPVEFNKESGEEGPHATIVKVA